MNEILEQKTNSAEKHKKYIQYYNSNEIYWGLGIENEIYLEFNKKKLFTKDFFLKNHKRERYSVNYFSNYKDIFTTESFNESFNELNKNDMVELPIILNSHSFLYTDLNNNSKKIYSKSGEPNPNFLGKTLDEEIMEFNKYFKETTNKLWLYDGDTFEFTTIKFYNSKLENVINELYEIKNEFILNLQKFQEKKNFFLNYGKIQFMQENYPFSVHLTNYDNIGIFNNGTLHYNITLPTQLNNNKMILDKKKFINDHKKAIKIIQYFEPLIISVYNTPDYFSSLKNFKNNTMYSSCSQRCAVSRYIGIGTYNTDLMLEGKILTVGTKQYNNIENWWYKKFHEGSAYNKLDEIGLDINFNKHYNHGIEIRFFDHITDEKLIKESFEFIIYLIDFILDYEYDLDNPLFNNIWNNLVYNVMRNGKKYILSSDEIKLFNEILNIDLKELNIFNVYYEIFHFLKNKYNDVKKEGKKYYLVPKGKFSKLSLCKNEIMNINNTIKRKKSICGKILSCIL
jgi:hypothetical protein